MQFIAYFRVSTQKQGLTQNGLQSQKIAVNNYVKSQEGGIISEFIEIESGKKNNRPELKKAIAAAKEFNATLLIAKLDRLSRNAAFILALKDSDVNFIAVDMPNANKLTVGILALVAEQEREFISQRTKAALQVVKQRGVKLGTPENLTDSARTKAVAKIQAKALANENNIRAAAYLRSLEGKKLTYRAKAKLLNDSHFKTSTGKMFFAASVKQLEKIFSL